MRERRLHMEMLRRRVGRGVDSSAPAVADFRTAPQSAGPPSRGRRQDGASPRRRPLSHDTRCSIVARLLHDDTIEFGYRVAGRLVPLYGLRFSRIVALPATSRRAPRQGCPHLGITS